MSSERKPLLSEGGTAYGGNMSDKNLGTDGTIPNSDDGIAVGHDPDGSHFNPEEEEETPTTSSTRDEESGSYTDVDE